MKKKLKKHLIIRYTAGCAITACGFYVDSNQVTAYRKYVTCGNCKRTK